MAKLSKKHIDRICGLPYVGPAEQEDDTRKRWRDMLTYLRGDEVYRYRDTVIKMLDHGAKVALCVAFNRDDKPNALIGMSNRMKLLEHEILMFGYRNAIHDTSETIAVDMEHVPIVMLHREDRLVLAPDGDYAADLRSMLAKLDQVVAQMKAIAPAEQHTTIDGLRQAQSVEEWGGILKGIAVPDKLKGDYAATDIAMDVLDNVLQTMTNETRLLLEEKYGAATTAESEAKPEGEYLN